MLSFQNPMAFLLILLVPVLHLLRYFKIFRRLQFNVVLSDWNGKSFEWNNKFQQFFSVFARIILILSYICVITAMADPVISHQEKVYTSLGTDLMFVVDTSPSMAAKDMDGENRLTSALKAIKYLSNQNEGFRFGLVVLGSEASVLVPPTSDHSYFETRLNDVKVGLLGNGSAIGDGIGTAVCHLASSKAPKKCIILLTDGENNAGEIHPETAAILSADNEIPLYIIGVGSKGTVPIEYFDPVTGKNYSGYLNSNYDASSLRRIAGLGNGHYFEVRSLEDLNVTLTSVVKKEMVVQNYSYRVVNELLYKKILILAIVLMVLASFIKRILLKEVL